MVQRDHGHGDNLLNRRRVDLLQHLHHLSLHLRHRQIKNLHVRQDVDNVHRGVPLYPWLWPHLDERWRPGGKHVLFVVHPVVHRACRPGVRSFLAKGAVHLTLLSLAPGLHLSPGGGVVLIRGQEHLQRELLVSPVRPKTALTAPPRCTVFVVATHRHVDHWASTEDHAKRGNANLSSLLLLFLKRAYTTVSMSTSDGS